MNTECQQVTSTRARSRQCLRGACVVVSSMLLAACVNPPRETAQADGDEECVYVKVTGSNLPVKECTTREQREALAAQNREAGEQGFRNLRDLGEFGVESAGADSLD